MMKPVYIKSACAISPQHSFEPAQFLQPVVSVADGKLFVVDADYRQYINPVAIRRMSRQLKMGITAGMRSLQLAGVQTPDAIITGTGLGSMTDMEHFLKDMINLNEEALNPTYFIQSTYNSINGWLALQSKSTGYNQTYVNRGCSLELSLLDAQLLLDESEGSMSVLTGCFDELTPDYFIVKRKVHYWKNEIPESLDLLTHSDTPGTIAGEGTAFFTLSNETDQAVCILKSVQIIQQLAGVEMTAQVGELLRKNGLTFSDVDILITGMNGDSRYQPMYDKLVSSFATNTTVTAFKHLCGEYPTSSGFALWLATWLFQAPTLPMEVVVREGNAGRPKHILIVNHYILGTASLMLLSRSA
jgi:3-oxoacyl-[acyl-carrier-protein] synthase II